MKNVIALMSVFFPGAVFSQTLIMNEVSNGPAGNREYVEFVVTDTAAVYNCGTTTPPCIDIRGWIFDDNSGYHGPSAGVAAGALRFSNDALWSCVPAGTIILIYNDADPNANVPPNDLSLADGNCRIVAPISSALFETNLTTPGAVACSYPATGWTLGGNWSTTLLANNGDCARIVNLSGCEIFSVCWASANLNTLIYFSSTGSGTDNVWYFNGGDPYDQANWSEGCADPTSCGADNQTPGLPNNAANAAFIAQFNNGCMPITPILSSIASFTDAGCGCDGTASASASGSIPGYTYTWYDAAFVPTGLTGSNVTGLCAGTYHVIAESSIGCRDTSTVTIGTTGTGLTVNVSTPHDTTCEAGPPFTLTGTPSGGTWSGTGVDPGTGSFNSSVAGAGTFTITYTVTSGGCTGSGSVDITVTPGTGTAVIDSVPAVCITDAPFMFTASPSGGFFYGSGGLSSSGLFDPGTAGGGTHLVGYQLTGPGLCKSIDSIYVQVIDPAVSMTPVPALCDDAAPFNLSASPAGGTWSGAGITNASLGTFDASVAGVGTHIITYTVGSGSCTGSGTISITVSTGGVTVNINPVAPVCETAAPFALSATPAGGTWSGTGVTASGTFNPATGSGSYWIFYTVSTSGPCGGIDSVLVQVDDAPTVSIAPVSTLCLDMPAFNLDSNIPGGTWSGTGIIMADSGKFSPAAAGIGLHTITYTVTNGACTSTATVDIQVVAPVNLIINALGPVVFCQGGSVQLTASGAGSLPVTWSNGQTGTSITVSAGGNYYAMVNGGCGPDTSNDIAVTVNTIDAQFVPDPATGQSPLQVSLVNNTVNSSSWYWSVNDTVYATDTDTSITYDTAGYYQVTLYVVSPEGCVDSLTQTIYVYGEFAVIVPNIFTPNGDLVNDLFSIDLLGVKALQVDVFNRWGQAIHAYANDVLTDGKVPVWDGKAQNGDPVSDGVYAFVLNAKGHSGEEQVLKGFITVIRSK